MVLFFIFNCAVVPVLTGVILWSMPKNQKGLGNGISSLVTTFLGKFPAPLIYGILQEKYSSSYNKIGMLGLMSTSFLGVIFLGLTTIYRYRTEVEDNKSVFEKKESDKKAKYEEEEDPMRTSINQEALATVFNNANIAEAFEINEDYYYNNLSNVPINDAEEMSHK